MIELRNITKAYRDHKTSVLALKDVSLHINKGEIFGVVGTSGAGKSTLIRTINLLERPDEGEVLINGCDITKLGTKDLQKARENMGMIFQHFNLFHNRSVFRNISYPIETTGMSKTKMKQRVDELLELVGLTDKAEVYPNQLSGGQKQRVAIARALAASPAVLLCDEATSALDPETTASILGLIADINKKIGITVVLITHEKAVVKKICHRVAVLEKGVIADVGDTIALFTAPKTAAAKAFVGDLAKEPDVRAVLTDYWKEAGLGGRIYKFSFVGQSTTSPFVAELAKKFDVSASILFGHVELIAGQTVGNLIVSLEGDAEENFKPAIQFLLDHGVFVEEVER